MDADFAARSSAWPAVLCYAAAIALRLSRHAARREPIIRILWTVGWLALVVHVGLALWLVHEGSWAAAYEHTARRTQTAVGWNWGGGVWFNLVTAIVWGLDVVWMWVKARRRKGVTTPDRRTNPLEWAGQFYLAFMIFNATVVFGSLPAQIVGGLGCVVIGLLALRRLTSRTPG